MKTLAYVIACAFAVVGIIGTRAWKDRGRNADHVRPLLTLIGDRYNVALGAVVAVTLLCTDAVNGGAYGFVSGLIPALIFGVIIAAVSRFLRDRIMHRG